MAIIRNPETATEAVGAAKAPGLPMAPGVVVPIASGLAIPIAEVASVVVSAT